MKIASTKAVSQKTTSMFFQYQRVCSDDNPRAPDVQMKLEEPSSFAP